MFPESESFRERLPVSIEVLIDAVIFVLILHIGDLLYAIALDRLRLGFTLVAFACVTGLFMGYKKARQNRLREDAVPPV